MSANQNSVASSFTLTNQPYELPLKPVVTLMEDISHNDSPNDEMTDEIPLQALDTTSLSLSSSTGNNIHSSSVGNNIHNQNNAYMGNNTQNQNNADTGNNSHNTNSAQSNQSNQSINIPPSRSERKYALDEDAQCAAEYKLKHEPQPVPPSSPENIEKLRQAITQGDLTLLQQILKIDPYILRNITLPNGQPLLIYLLELKPRPQNFLKIAETLMRQEEMLLLERENNNPLGMTAFIAAIGRVTLGQDEEELIKLMIKIRPQILLQKYLGLFPYEILEKSLMPSAFRIFRILKDLTDTRLQHIFKQKETELEKLMMPLNAQFCNDCNNDHCLKNCAHIACRIDQILLDVSLNKNPGEITQMPQNVGNITTSINHTSKLLNLSTTHPKLQARLSNAADEGAILKTYSQYSTIEGQSSASSSSHSSTSFSTSNALSLSTSNALSLSTSKERKKHKELTTIDITNNTSQSIHYQTKLLKSNELIAALQKLPRRNDGKAQGILFYAKNRDFDEGSEDHVGNFLVENEANGNLVFFLDAQHDPRNKDFISNEPPKDWDYYGFIQTDTLLALNLTLEQACIMGRLSLDVIIQSNVEQLKTVLDCNPDILKVSGLKGESALTYLLRHHAQNDKKNLREKIQLLANKKPQLLLAKEATDESHFPLSLAIDLQLIEEAKLLLKLSPQATKLKIQNNVTVLMLAALHANNIYEDIMKTNKNLVLAKTKNGKTAIDYALANFKTGISSETIFFNSKKRQICGKLKEQYNLMQANSGSNVDPAPIALPAPETNTFTYHSNQNYFQLQQNLLNQINNLLNSQSPNQSHIPIATTIQPEVAPPPLRFTPPKAQTVVQQSAFQQPYESAMQSLVQQPKPEDSEMPDAAPFPNNTNNTSTPMDM